MRRAGILLILASIVSCGGDSGTTPTTTTTTTMPPVTYNGSYTGSSMTWTGGGGQAIVVASTEVTQTGSNLTFGSFEISSPIEVTYGMGDAVLNDNTFDGTNQYSSTGCGVITNHYRGYFSGDGNIMNMTMTLTSDACAEIDVRGEMRR